MIFKQIHSKHKFSLVYLAVSWFTVLCACGDGTHQTDTGALSLNIVYKWSENSNQRAAEEISCSGDGIDEIVAYVYGPDDSQLATGGPWDCELHHGIVFSVPTGENRKVVLFGLRRDEEKNEHLVLRGDAIIPWVHSGLNDRINVPCNAFIPSPQSPVNAAMVREDDITFEWTPVDGAFEYHLLVSENSDLTDPVIDICTKKDTYAPDPGTLLMDKIYYWQIYAKDNKEMEGMPSDIRSFTCTHIPGKLPDTGQQGDYTVNPRAYTKLDTGGDELESDATQWAMVRDNVTGLIWEVKTDDGTIHDKDQVYSWQGSQDEFVAQLNEDNFGGHADWRLPTIKELSMLANFGSYNPALDRRYFRHINTDNHYWTSTEAKEDKENLAWHVIFFIGGSKADILKGEESAVMAVRGNKTGYDLISDFVDNGDGTVTDRKTGLMWQKADGQFESSNNVTWKDASEYCDNLVLGEGKYEDWRLPNIRELQSIFDYDDTFEAGLFLFDGAEHGSGRYWSSTTFARDDSRKWYVSFENGHIYGSPHTCQPDGQDDKICKYRVRAVRGGS